MTRQTMLQVKKESQPLQTGSLFRRQAAQAPVEEHDTAPLPVGFGRDYSHIPFRPPQPPPPMASVSCPFSPQRCPFGGACHACPPKMQAKLKIGQPGDRYEQEADHVAEQVMRMPEPQAQRKCSAPGCKDEDDEKKLLQTKPASAGEAGAQVDHPLIQSVLSSSGQPLDAGTRSFMEPRFGQDFSGVRVHVGGEAAESARAVNARAYTVGRDVVFGEGQYAPGSDEGKRLVAHELVHVGQQDSQKQIVALPDIQRIVEVRPPGRGEASAFDRREEFIDRLNTLSTGLQYRLDGRRIVYDVIDQAAFTNFDRQMLAFLDRPDLVPMRLITSAGRVQEKGKSVPLLIDSFVAGYVDLDDMLASDDLSFQMNLIHLLTERFQVHNYERRIGTNISEAEFNRAHNIGIEAETELLRNVTSDPTIRFNYEEVKPNGTLVFAFRSQEGYKVFHVFRRSGQERQGGEIFVQTMNGRRLTIDQLIVERASTVER